MNIYGVRGYLTPDNLPSERHCRTFSIPDNVQWLSVFMGALLPLIYPENWQMYGELTPDEAADEMLDVIWNAYAEDEGVCPIAETPYWDAAADVGETAPPDAQSWYGQVADVTAPPDELDFVENLAIWAFAGFLAYSGEIGAAISFVTVAPKFVLAWKRGDVGELIRVIVDAADVTVVDTSTVASGDIVSLSVVGNPDNETHQIYLVKVG